VEELLTDILKVDEKTKIGSHVFETNPKGLHIELSQILEYNVF
jgi:hypothetical protein